MTAADGPRRRRGRPLGALALAAMLVSAAGPAAAEQLTSKPDAARSRIVAIGGAITEIVYVLAAEDRLIAVDSTSRYPPQAAELPNVGYMRQLAAEPIVALSPTLVLAVEDAGPPAILDQLRAAGVPLVMVPDEASPQGVLAKVTTVARALDLADEGRKLAARLAGEFAALRAQIGGIQHRPKVLFLLSIGAGAPLAGGRDTAAAGIIELAGGRNAVEAFEGFKPFSPEAAAPAAPDVVLVTERTLSLLGGREALLRRPEVAVTPAGREGRVVAMDGLLLLGFGPRTPAAARALAEKLHAGLPEPR